MLCRLGTQKRHLLLLEVLAEEKKTLCQEVSKYCRRKAPYIKTAVTPGLGIESKRRHRAIKTQPLQNS